MNVIEVLCEDAEDVTAHYDPQFSKEQHRTHLCSSPFLVSCCHLILVCLILSPLLFSLNLLSSLISSSHFVFTSHLVSSQFFSFLILSRPLFSLSRLSALILLVCLFSDLLSSCIVSSVFVFFLFTPLLSSFILSCFLCSSLSHFVLSFRFILHSQKKRYKSCHWGCTFSKGTLLYILVS